MKKINVFILIISILLWSLPVSGKAEAPNNLYAQSAVLMDAGSGRILFEKNGNEKRPMASTTKIMTCILTLEQSQQNAVVEVSANAASQPKVHLGMKKGEQFYLNDLLYSLMLESHNDTAVAIAEHIGGSVKAFAGLMNEKAKELGCMDTYFITPNGLDSQDAEGIHSTTAADLARIMKYCITESPKKEEFLNITGKNSYAFSDVQGTRSFSCVNHNAFLSMMEGAFTGKTGFTGNAGYCYVGALKRDGKTLIVALLACGWPNNKGYKWSDTRKLMEYGIQDFQYKRIRNQFSFKKILVREGIPKTGNIRDPAYVSIGSKSSRNLSILLGKHEHITVKAVAVQSLKAPVRSGERVGSIYYYLDGEQIYQIPIIVKNAVEKITFTWCADKIINRFFGIP